MNLMKITAPARIIIITGTGLLVLLGLLAMVQLARASHAEPHDQQPSPLHPSFAFLDKDGANVLDSSNPLSTLMTCGQCHDTEFITSHSYHSDAGLSNFGAPGHLDDTLPWDSSGGLFGKWDSLLYRYLTADGDEKLDLSTAEWIKTYGQRHIGSGPASISRDGQPLESLTSSLKDPEANILNPVTGRPQRWDWNESGTVEMNCFLCHFTQPNNESRIAAILEGKFKWANTATLMGTGLVNANGSDFSWNQDAFAQDGKLKESYVLIQDPDNANCNQCHGLVESDPKSPVVLSGCELDFSEAARTGQIISSQRISESGMNIKDKDMITHSWDVHAERSLTCTDCHYSLNNPIYSTPDEQAPEHLLFDPRTLDLGEYLKQPDHNFAHGNSKNNSPTGSQNQAMRRCDSCHDASKSHASWLPHTERHMSEVACETCHVPTMYAPAIQSYDWTVLKPDSTPAIVCRGSEGSTGTITDLVTGYQPVILQQPNVEGNNQLAPYNLITSYFWVYTDTNGNIRPVRLADLQTVYLEGGDHSAEIIAAFDEDGNNTIDDSELVIDSKDKETLIASRLTALGLDDPHIEGLVQAFRINHNVVTGKYATNDCTSCHNRDSHLTTPMTLAVHAPADVVPVFEPGTPIDSSGNIVIADNGSLLFAPSGENIYVLGYSYVSWIDAFGALLFVGVMLGIMAHATLRVISRIRRKPTKVAVRKVYMYDSYERLWHWLQTAAIVILLFTGLIIHRPDLFGAFSFRNMVYVHNIIWMLLAINAFLALFYHLASGRIKQFIPRPYGFFDEAIVQAKYYIKGIFKHEHHPFEKTPERKLNPLQQVTYFGILNLLLPLQGLTGIAMWGVQRWPEITTPLGGLVWLAPFHTLIAWVFASFILGHVYLTTTGPKPLDGIKGMVTGWEEVESPRMDNTSVTDAPDASIGDESSTSNKE